MANLLSKINIGGVLYDLKDAYAREQIALILEDAAKHMDSTGIYADDAAVKAAIEAGDKAVKDYVDAQVGAINKFDVAVLTDDQALPTASADTMYVLYLKPDKDSASGTYVEYITIRSGEEDAYTYAWEAIGSTKMDVTGFVTNEALEETLEDYAKSADLGDLAAKDEADLDLKALAHKDSATGTVAGETITGVKATGTTTGSINVALEATQKDVASAGKYTPVGNVSGTVTPTGSVSVTVSNSAADATLTKGDYTPAGSVSVALTGASFDKITSVGTQAQFTEGEFTAATLDKEDVTASYATEGIVGAVDGETLTFTAAGIAAITASKINNFDGGKKDADTFVANSLPTKEAHTVGVESATFTGTLAEDLVVTNVSYAKANADAAATFTGNVNDIAATFTGTEGDIEVVGKANDYAVKTAEFNGAAIELAVGDIAVSAKDVTVQ